MNNSNEVIKPRILITGETAGTGASTTSKILAEKLSLPLISGGKFFRALANRFAVFEAQKAHLDQEACYEQFLKQYQDVYEQQGLEGINILLADAIEQGAKGDVLAKFGEILENRTEKTGSVDPVWDYIVDEQTIMSALSQPGFIWEAKLAVLALHLDEFRSTVAQFNTLSLPYIKILLRLDPLIAAQRVASRENREVNVQEIMLRKQRDFDRYGELYKINTNPLSHQDLYTLSDLHINTEKRNPNRVARLVLKGYLHKINSTGQSSSSVVTEIKSAIASLGQ